MYRSPARTSRTPEANIDLEAVALDGNASGVLVDDTLPGASELPVPTEVCVSEPCP